MTYVVTFDKIKRLYPQLLSACAAWLIICEIGVIDCWSSPYLAQLTSVDSPIPLSLSEASWVASILYIGRFVGAVLGSVCVSFYGSKKTCLITAIPMAVGWIVTFAAGSMLLLCIARTILGMGYGFAYSCFALYLGEVALPELRGSLVSFAVMGARFGNVIAGFTGTNMSLSRSSISYFVPCMVLVFLFSFLPDSPHYLVKIGDLEAAKNSIDWYHRGEKNSDDELKELVKFVRATASTSFTEKLAEFRSSHVKKATLLVMMLFIFMQMCGLNSVLFYMEIILRKSESQIIDPSSAVSYILLSAIVVTMATTRFYEKYGRRILWIISSIGVSMSLTALGTHFILLTYDIDWIGAQWLPIAALFFSLTFFGTGLTTVPNIVSSEIYADNVKSVAACFANLTASATAFVASKAYQPVVDLYGEAYVFYIHGFITFLAIPYALLFMPETKGKTLQQIQNDLVTKK